MELPRTRVLQFPVDASYGTLHIAQDQPEGWSWVHLRSREIGPAQGTVTCTLAAGEFLWLRAISGSALTFPAVASLLPDALDGLYGSAGSAPEETLAAIQHLAGLRMLALHGRTLPGAALAPLAALPGLERLILLGLRDSTGGGCICGDFRPCGGCSSAPYR
jgi:hypothetical protein